MGGDVLALVLVGARDDEAVEALFGQSGAQGRDARRDLRRIARLGEGLEAAGGAGIGHVGLGKAGFAATLASARGKGQCKTAVSALLPQQARTGSHLGDLPLGYANCAVVNGFLFPSCVFCMLCICEHIFSQVRRRPTLVA